MPKRNSADHSTGYSERYADETVSDSKQSSFALDHLPDDWRQTDFAHRFKDELKAINDCVAANFDSSKKLTEYTGDERKQLAYATAEAFRAMALDRSMAPRSWATGAVESCATDVMTDGSKSGRVATLHEQERTALTVRPILRRDRLALGTRRFPHCA